MALNKKVLMEESINKKGIELLSHEYRSGKTVLFLGSGVSEKANIPTWKSLVTELFVTLIGKRMKEEGVTLSKEEQDIIIEKMMKHQSHSPLLQAGYITSGLEQEFEQELAKIMYVNAVDTSPLLEEIGQLCANKGENSGIRAIVNYNFDDLIEKNLKRLGVKHRSVYTEGFYPDHDELGIYHVHGFLPRQKDEYENISNSLIVFSEDGYDTLLLEPYNWANLTQLKFLLHNTCIFIGLSLTDPNLRRLLQIAMQKRGTRRHSHQHYAFFRRLSFLEEGNNEHMETFNLVNQKLKDSYFQELGVKIIWIDDFDEIPEILKSLNYPNGAGKKVK